MNRDDVTRMAQECQLIGMRPHLDGVYQQSLERFAALVAAAEREACAKVCCSHEKLSSPTVYLTGYTYAQAIRARGQE